MLLDKRSLDLTEFLLQIEDYEAEFDSIDTNEGGMILFKVRRKECSTMAGTT